MAAANRYGICRQRRRGRVLPRFVSYSLKYATSDYALEIGPHNFLEEVHKYTSEAG